MTTAISDFHEAIKRSRQQHVDAVLASNVKNKIVVAGPGTGKTHLFRTILEGKTNTLTLTFVNSLVEDLSLELFGISEVRTLHGFARQQLKRFTRNSINIFPKLAAVIRYDALMLLGNDIDFDTLFNNKADENDLIEFYRKRKIYYKYHGFSDLVYSVVRQFEKYPVRIPQYTQIVVDEFQDFNALEVALIELLALRSPVLLVGDDDQALYEALKCASTQHIRQRHADRTLAYQSFPLPYCSRCTRVIVNATNDIVSNAIKAGHLIGRIQKPFQYFDDPQKDQESNRYPAIIHGHVFANQIPWFIQCRIKEIAKEVKENFSVLVISPTRKQCKHIMIALRDKGFHNVHYAEKLERPEPSLLNGLNLLLEDDSGNLGWRIAAKVFLQQDDFRRLLMQTMRDDDPPHFIDIMPLNIKKEIKRLLRILRAARDGKQIQDDELIINSLKQLGADPVELAMESIRDQLSLPGELPVEFGIRKILISVSTVASSKGLAADYVFITHFDDRFFIKAHDRDQIADQDICGFIVALTRARREVFLISSVANKEPKFLNWIDKSRIHMTE